MIVIKFRAVANVNDKYNGIKKGDFVYGSFVETNIYCQIIFGDGEQISVDRKTVGQYTGLKDKNGFGIYEGDIVKWGHIDGYTERMPRIAIVSLDPSLNFRTINLGKNNDDFHYGSFAYANCIDKCMEVIGNIHKNPELLEK